MGTKLTIADRTRDPPRAVGSMLATFWQLVARYLNLLGSCSWRELNKGDERNTIGNGMKMRTLRGNGGEENGGVCLEKEIDVSRDEKIVNKKGKVQREKRKRKEERYK